MPADILIYALVAAGLVFWLRSVLGTRHGDERQRPNPFSAPAQGTPESTNPVNILPGLLPGAENQTMLADAIALPRDSRYVVSASNADVALTAIARQDRSFHFGQFLQGAQDAFVMIVEAFAAGNRDLLKDLLAPAVYNAFEKAIADREGRGETMVTEIHALRRIEVADIQLKDKTVEITLRLVADETSVTKDKNGLVIEGNPDRVSETIDIWTFSRNIRSKDPTWFLKATREEQVGAAPTPNAGT